MKISFKDLKTGFIVGIIDSYGAVHSTFDKECRTHEDLYPMQTFKRWRWCFRSCFNSGISNDDLSIEDWDKIERHITRKYGIRFWENGYTDLDHFKGMLNKK